MGGAADRSVRRAPFKVVAVPPCNLRVIRDSVVRSHGTRLTASLIIFTAAAGSSTSTMISAR